MANDSVVIDGRVKIKLTTEIEKYVRGLRRNSMNLNLNVNGCVGKWRLGAGGRGVCGKNHLDFR